MDIGKYSMLDYKAWPDIVSITKNSSIAWYDKPPSWDKQSEITCWNAPIEWVIAKTSGLLLKNLVEKDSDGMLGTDFWKKVYNIGNGKAARVTGFETLDRGFKMMGRSAVEIFKPEWNAIRNFHCMWFADSRVLNDYLDFQYEGFEEFFARLEKKLRYFKLGKPFPRLIRRFALMPLLRTNNAPTF